MDLDPQFPHTAAGLKHRWRIARSDGNGDSLRTWARKVAKGKSELAPLALDWLRRKSVRP